MVTLGGSRLRGRMPEAVAEGKERRRTPTYTLVHLSGTELKGVGVRVHGVTGGLEGR